MILAASSNRDDILDVILDKAIQKLSHQDLQQHISHENNSGDTAFTLALKQGATECANLLSNVIALQFPSETTDSKKRSEVRGRSKSGSKPTGKQHKISKSNSATMSLARTAISLSQIPQVWNSNNNDSGSTDSDGDQHTVSANINIKVLYVL